MPCRKGHQSIGPRRESRSRRRFLKTSALAAAGAASAPLWVASPARASGGRPRGRSNVMPGRIVIYHDVDMEGHQTYINSAHVEGVVHHGVRLLTGIADTAAAFESLFPGLTSTSKFAIKVNVIGPCDTRWETVRGIVSGLSLMLGGTYDVSQVTIYDRDPIVGHGYWPSRFTFNGNCPFFASGSNPGSYYIWPGRRLSQYVVDADYVINVPVLKAHNFIEHEITISLKNHFGSCTPPDLCHNIPAMLGINTDPYIKEKTTLVLVDAIRATYNGEPIAPPMVWEIFAPEGTPNTMFFSTDPTTSDYCSRDLINEERAARGWPQRICPWIEASSGHPYNLGVSNPEEMTILRYDPALAAVEENEELGGRPGVFAPCEPNPVTEAARLRFSLERPQRVSLRILDASGRTICDLGEADHPAGPAVRVWDARDRRGARAPSGVYYAQLRTDRGRYTQRIIVARR